MICAATGNAQEFNLYIGMITGNLNGNTLTITGKGEVLPPYDTRGGGTKEMREQSHRITTVIIGNGITGIHKEAFSFFSNLTSVTIPNSVTMIRDDAFSNCSSLTKITIPNSVTSIGNSAFYGCSGLTKITIPESVTTIGELAFSDCSSLTEVIIPNSVTSIVRGAFSGSGLTSINVDSNKLLIRNKQVKKY